MAMQIFAGCSKRTLPDSSGESYESTRTPQTIGSSDASERKQSHLTVRDTDWFEDVTESLGIRFRYQNGVESERYTILETVGGGIAVFDYDGNGELDLFCAGGGTIDSKSASPGGVLCELFRQRGAHFERVTSKATMNDDIDYSHGCFVNDFNNDGFPDLFVTCYGFSRLFVNCGDGTFTDSSSVLKQKNLDWNTGAAFGDVNGDGNSDLYVTAYLDWKPNADETCRQGPNGVQDVCPPQEYSAIPDSLFLNSGDGQFQKVSEVAGIRADGMGLGVIATDLNKDGAVEFYVANDVVANHLYSSWDGQKFQESGEVSGAGLNESGSPEGSMGVDAEDIDGDGWLDLFVTNFELEDNSLYRSLGSGADFLHATSRFGLGGQGRRLVGFGTGFCDFDSDGWSDLYVLNGHVLYHNGQEPFRQPAAVYRNVAGKRFQAVTNAAGAWFQTSHASRGGAVGDFNNDGTPDLLVSCLNEPLVVLKNRKRVDNWIRLQLVGTKSARLPVGACVSVPCFGRDRLRWVKSGAGYLSHSDDRLLFALSEDQPNVTVIVTWPSGLKEEFNSLRSASHHVIIEGHGKEQNSP